MKSIRRHIPQLFAKQTTSSSRDVIQEGSSLSVNVSYDIMESWLRPPCLTGSQDKVGVWKEKKFPTLISAPVPDKKENKFLDTIPTALENEDFESWIMAPSLISGRLSVFASPGL